MISAMLIPNRQSLKKVTWPFKIEYVSSQSTKSYKSKDMATRNNAYDVTKRNGPGMREKKGVIEEIA